MKQEWSRRELYAHGEPFGDCATQRKLGGGYVCGGGGKGGSSPDYAGAAQAQGAASKEVTNIQNWANRPDQKTPWGNTTWSSAAAVDPATGQNVTKWTQNTSLDPTLQRALDQQFQMQEGRSNLANSFMDRTRDAYNAPMTSYDSAPGYSVASAPKDLRTSFGYRGPQFNLNTGDNPALPTVDSGYRDQVASQLMERMQPIHDRQNNQLETRLANQGLTVGSDAYKTALDQQNQRQAAERYNALDTAGQEAQRLYNMQMGSRQQAFNEDLGTGQFYNSATGQDYTQNLGSANFGNTAKTNQYNLNRQQSLDQNQVRQAMIAEEMQKRAQALNEMNSVMNGQQVSMPTMPSFVSANRSETPDYIGAASAQGQANSNTLGGLFGLGGTLLGANTGSIAGKLFGF